MRLRGLDELFSLPDLSTDSERESIQEISIAELHHFHNHPFRVLEDAAMQSMVESIREYGVLMPVIARPLESGGYELISGHRRRRGCELAGLDTMPVIVRQMGDDEATILMVDSNIQRENILPSERAFAYKMKLEAVKRQGARSDLTSTQVVQKLSAEKIGDDAGTSREQVRRFIRLTELIPELLETVDSKKVAFIPAVELNFRTREPVQTLRRKKLLRVQK